MLTSNPKFDGKLHYEAAPEGAPLGEGNSGRWFKRVALTLVLLHSAAYWLTLHGAALASHLQAQDVALLALAVFIDGTHFSNDGGTKAVPVYLTAVNIDSSVCR